MTAIDIRALAVEVDTIHDILREALFEHAMLTERAIYAVHYQAGDQRVWSGHDYEWQMTFLDARVKADQRESGRQAVAAYDRQEEIKDQIREEMADCHAVWLDHRWTRAFLVTNTGGHVHSSMDCSTCFDSTRYEWLTGYSGADEDEIVKAAGEIACTVCYPSAPSEYLNRPPNLISATRAEREAAAAERATAKAEREAKRKAKAPTAEGSPLIVPEDEWGHPRATLNTEVTARKTWNGIQDRRTGEWGTAGWRRVSQAQIDAQYLIESALAAKHGMTQPEMRADLERRYAKRRTS